MTVRRCKPEQVFPSKIIHWIIFEIDHYEQSVLENFFTCKKFSNFQKCA